MQAQNVSLWRHPNFLKLWIGQSVSLFGDQITLLAVPLVAVVTLHVPAAQLGFLGATETAPILVLGLMAGVWVDRLPRRLLLIGADLGRAVLLLLIPLAAWLGLLHMLILYIVAFGVGTLSVFFGVAYQAFLPTLLPREQLIEGNSKLEISRSGSQVAGPAIAGFLMQFVTPPFAILLDAGSFLWSALCVSLIRAQEPGPPPRREQRHLWAEMMIGLRFVFGNPILRAIAGCTGTANLFGSVITTILVLYLVRDLGATAGLLGIISASSNLGFLFGATLARRTATRFGLGRTLVGAPILASIGALLIPLARGPLMLAVPLLIGAQFLGSLGGTIYSINQLTLRQTITPERLQGRMSASMRFIVIGAMPIGALLGGMLGQTIGLWPTLVVGAAGRLLPVLWVWFSPIRHTADQWLAKESAQLPV
ncbi:MFS transporter [Thermogemmatispora carboxidivorans]|uniref:MFS transporter n=1 Tax=Thermogemmatispora carboxidivorans TaxID=1382306 RepID=UPI0006992F2A|nr:MFS transporter [Thermogemmatispora carboxidivorans]